MAEMIEKNDQNNNEENKQGLSALEELKKTPDLNSDTQVVYESKIDNLGRSYSTGRRKNAKARVWVKRGTGQIIINDKDFSKYFARPVLQMIIVQPLEIIERKNEFDVKATVVGGGLSGQAGAIRHGISRALTLFEPELRPKLKAGGFLTRDPRVVERKKYGKAKARKSFQFSKR